MSKDKMHEIGILKALGTQNGTVGTVFGLQVVLIALLTCILSVAGYYYFIDLANDVLIESLKRLAPSRIVLDLNFLTFQKDIARDNCILVCVLSVVALIPSMIKVKVIKLNRIKPVDEEAYDIALEAKHILFVEEGVRSGGVGEKFAATLLQKGYKGTYNLTAVDDCFVKQAKIDELYKQFGFDSESIAAKVKEIIKLR